VLRTLWWGVQSRKPAILGRKRVRFWDSWSP